MGNSKKDLRALPADVVDTFGYALYLAQVGKRHDDTKVMRGFGGASVLEVIKSQAGNAGIETPKPDMDLIEKRLQKASELMNERKS
jgi:phage-related protein